FEREATDALGLGVEFGVGQEWGDRHGRPLVLQAGARPVSQPPAPVGTATGGAEVLGAIGGAVCTLADLWHAAAAIRHVSRNHRHGRSVCRPANNMERGMPNGVLSCAACGRSLEVTAAWKGKGERYYCNDFCADAEAVESPSLIPSLTEAAPPRTAAMPSRAPCLGRAPRAPAGRPTGDAVPHSRLSATIFFRSGGEAGGGLCWHDLHAADVGRVVGGVIGPCVVDPADVVSHYDVPLPPRLVREKFFSCSWCSKINRSSSALSASAIPSMRVA